MTYRLPSTNALLIGVLRPALPVPVYTQVPNPAPAPLTGYIVAHGEGGTDVDPRFVRDAVVIVESWDATETGAEQLSEDARLVLLMAWLDQVVVPGVGSIAHFSVDASAELLVDTTPKGVFRYQATYRLVTRAHNMVVSE